MDMEWHYGNMKHFASIKGKQMVHELIVNYVITRGNRQSAELWRAWCIKNDLCGKGTKIISLNMHHMGEAMEADNHRNNHMIRVLNGRGQYLVNVNITDKELREYLGE